MTLPLGFEGGDLPPVIQRAIARTMDPRLELTHAERVALATLVARAEAKDGTQSFWVKRCNFAELFGKVERTVSAWLAALEEKGWITKEQGRTRWGSFKCLTLHLTDKASTYLGLSIDSDRSGLYRKKISAGIKEVNQELKQSFQRHPAGSSSYPQNRNSEDRVPSDCKELLNLGIRPSAIFKLMGIASSRGKRLSAIVRSKLSALAKAKNPYALAVKLANDNVDYGAMAESHANANALSEADVAQRELIQATKSAYEGKWVRGKHGEPIFFRPGGFPEVYKENDGLFVYSFPMAGKRLVKFWEWLSSVRPTPTSYAA